jgi:hypothetical protein
MTRVGTALIAGGSVIGLLGLASVSTVLAWSAGSLTLTAKCAPDASTYAWTVGATETETNYNVDFSYNGITWAPDTPLFGSTPPYELDTVRTGVTELWVRWDSDTSVTAGPVNANGDLCTPAAPSIGTQTVPGSPVAIGISVYDTATLTGATSDAGGTVTYGLYSNNTCNVDHLVANLTPTPTANAVVDGVVPSSTSYSFTSAGIWYFQATYSGDSNNTGPVSSSCTSEAVVVSPNAPSIGTLTVPGSPVAIGTSVYDTATLTGATSGAGGTVSYGLYSNSTCSSLVKDLTPTDNTVIGGVVPKSNSYVFTSAGTGYFQATYLGDSNNTGRVSSPCESEAVLVSPNAPSIGTLTVPGSPVKIGTSVHDTATLTGATSDAGGSVTYGLYSDSSCKDLVANLTPSPDAVSGGVVLNSEPYVFTSAGTWYFQATYSGDPNNLAAVSVCGNELFTVSPTPTPTGSVSAATSTPTPTPAGAVAGITTPSTGGAAPTGGGWGWLSPILVLLGSLVLVAQFVVRRRVRSGKIKIQDI